MSGITVKTNISLKKYSTFKIGGLASFFVQVSFIEDFMSALRYAKKKNLGIVILGSGSNILFPDTKLYSLVIKINLLGVSFNKRIVEAYAGEDWDNFVEKTLENNLYGLENLSSIPGTVGATPIQNVGAYGVEVSEFILEV